MPESLADLKIQLTTANARIVELQSQLAVQNPERYRSIVENQTELICRYTPEFILTYVNPAYSSHFGLTPEKMIGTSLFSFIPDEDQPAALALIGTATAANPVCISEHRTRMPDGSVRWYEWTDQAILGSNGQIVEYQGIARDISKRIKAQDNFNSLSTILEQSCDLMATSDLLGNITYMNAGGAAMLGYPSPEIALNTTIADFYLAEDWQRILKEYIPIAVQTGEWRGENRVKTCSGKIIEVEQTIFAVRDRESNLKSYATVMVDITERKGTLKALKDSEEKYRSLVESFDSNIVMLDREGDFLFANKNAAERFHLEPEAIVGRNVKELMLPEEVARYLEIAGKVIDTGQGIVGELPGTLDGEVQWFRTSIQPVLAPSGTPFAILINATNITKLKEAEAARRESEELLQELMKHLPGTCAILDENNTLLFCNEFYAGSTGHTREEILGKELKTYLQPELYVNAINQIEQVLSQKKVMEFSFKVADSRYWKIILFPILRQGLPPNIGAIGLDITREKEAEEILQKAHDQLELRVKERTAELEGTKNRLEAIFNSSTNSLLLLDTKAGIIQANHTFDKMFGFVNYEGRQLSELIQPEDPGKLEASILEVAKSRKAAQLEALTRQADGSLVETEISLAPVSDPSQPVNNLVCIIRDVTERKKAQKTIAEERNLLRTLIDAIPDFIYIKDTQHRMILNNKAHALSLGNKTPEEVVGTTDFDMFPLDMATKFCEDENRLFKTQQALISVEERSIGVDGSEIWASTTKVPLKNLAGEVIGLVGITHDISNLKSSEDALRRSEENLRESQQMLLQVLDTIPVRVFWKDQNLVYRGCNRLFADDAGLATTTDIIGKKDEELPWTANATAAYVADDREVIESSVAKLNYEEKQTTLTGKEITLQTSKLPLRDIAGNIIGVLGTYIDISDQKATQEALQRNQADLESIIESTSLAFVLYDLDGRVRLFNRLAQEYQQKYFGFSLVMAENKIGSNPIEVQPILRERFAGVISGEQAIIEIPVEDGDKTIYFEFRYYPVKSSRGEIIGVSLAFEDVTTRKENELQLRYLASLQENMLEAVSAIDLQFNIKSWNKAAERIYGWTVEEAIGKNVAELIPSVLVSGETEEETMQEILEKGVWSGETIQRRRDGSKVNILSSMVLLKDAEGNPTGLVGVSHDITDRKRSEIVLEEKRQQELELQGYLKALHEISVELTAISKLDEFYKKVVQFGLERLGFERLGFFLYDSKTEQAIGTYGTDAQGKVVSEQHLRFELTTYTHIMNQAMYYPDRYSYGETAPLFTNGEFIGIGWNAAVSLWQGSELLGWLTIDNGVSHKPIPRYTLEVLSLYRMTVAVLLANKLVEEKLQSTYQRLELATKTGGIGIWDWNLKDGVLVWDDQMFALFGTTREILPDKYNDWASKVIHSDDLKEIQSAVNDTIVNNTPYEIEFRVSWPNGSMRHIKSNAMLLRDEEGQPTRMIGVNWDITNLKRSEETLKEALKKEKELGELKSSFVSRASHEFRTPLAAILATTESLSIYRAKMTEAQMDIRLDKIRQQIMYLKGIMEDVLELSRIQSGRIEFRPSRGNIDELCQSIITEFESQAEYKNRIIYTGTNSPLIATFDSRLIWQVIGNLLSNALKYSPSEKPVYLNLSDGDSHVILKVRDEGIGIPPEDMKSLFEPFQRASNVGTTAGTGLGLSIALQSVEMHQGTISVESELSVGTTFTLTIPKLIVKGKENDENTRN